MRRMHSSLSYEDDFQDDDMEESELQVSLDRVLKDDERIEEKEHLVWFGWRAIMLGLTLVAIIAASVGVAVWFRQENATNIPTSSSMTLTDDLTIPSSSLRERNAIDNCWVAFYGNVYNLTNYNHPGPQQWITDRCGSDATAEYAAAHPEVYMRTIEHLYVGVYQTENGKALF